MSRIAIAAFIVILCFWTTAPGWSQTFNFRTREASVIKTATQIKAHNGFMDTIIVRQDKWDEMVANGSSWSNNLKFKSVHAFVKFYVNHAYGFKIFEPYTFRLAYKIYGYGNMADTNAYTSFNDTLTISYKPDSLSAFQDMQYKKYSNFHKIMVVMTGLYKIDGASGTPVAMNLSTTSPFNLLNFNVEGSILVQPYHKRVKVGASYVNVYGPAAPALIAGADAPVNDYLPVRWNLTGASLTGNLELTPANYELEWTYVDNYRVNPSTGAITAVPATSLSYNFKENSTRVWLDTNYYRIPMIYQKGYVLFRVRMVRPDSTQYRYPVYGPWSLASESGLVSSIGSIGKYEITQAHLSDSLNWQYTVSFAEQGKYKHVMSYYDGMLKNRQSITRFNSNESKLIATEQVYDFEGRPSISLLPTPVNSMAFRYQFNLTLNESTGLPYKAHDFDILSGSVCPLDKVPPRLANASPADQYYSSDNSDKAGFQKFVPDAGGYPFVQTIYSPGYDERVEKQGGAGDSLQVGFNHNVKNDYVSADQMDLNRLFGTNIGLSGFYRKTVSRDPNGQLSLNVTDYKGKTVTSSMIGIPDTTIHSIVANENLPDTSFYQEDHIAGTAQQVMGNKIILDKNFFNDAGGNNLAQYIYTFKPFLTFCPGKYLTVAARYDYTIFDECGNIDLDTGGVLGTSGVTTSGSPVTTSSAQIPFYMEKGKHSIHKELTVNTDEVDKAVDQFMTLSPAENCLKNEPWFIKQSVLSKEFPCPEEYNDMDCNSCEGKKFQMMQELWPNKDSVNMVRKYGIYRHQGSGLVAGNNNSIFTIISGGGDLGPIVYRYQDPCMVQLPASVTKNGHTYTNLQSLPVDTFIYIFNDSIAEALLPMHPEYCELLKCFDDKYADKLRSIPDASIAAQLGLMYLTGMINGDPLYAKMLTLPSVYPNAFDTLAHFTGGISLDTMALIQAYCGCNDSTMFQDCRNNIFASQINGGILSNDYIKDRYFETVRNLYIASRSRYLFNLSPVGALAACTTCQNVRMTLVPPPVFMTFMDSTGGLATGPGSFLGTLQTLSPATGSALSNYYTLLQSANLTQQQQQLNDSALTIYLANDSALCTGAVDAIMVQLVNCAAPSSLNGVRSYLLNLCQTNQVSLGYFTPEQITSALTTNGIALNDICNQYLVNYDDNMNYSSVLDQGGFTCNSDAFYADASSTLSTTIVKNVLKNTGTSATLPLTAGNQFQQELISALGASSCTVTSTINTTTHLQTLSFINGTQKVNLYFKTAASGLCASPFSTPSNETISIAVSCVNPPGGFASGYIGKYGFTATVTHVLTGGNVSCSLPAWNNKIAMNNEGENPIAKCVPCTQMRALYNDFQSTVLSPLAVKGTDHPYFKTMLRNFMNYRLKKAYTEAQYIDFMESCALSDYGTIRRYVSYADFTFATQASMLSFVNALNNLDPAVAITPIMIADGVYFEADIDISGVPKNKLKLVKDFLSQYTTTYTANINHSSVEAQGPTSIGSLFVNGSSTFYPNASIFNGSTNAPTFYLHGTFNVWNGTSFEPTRIYRVNSPNINAYSDNNRNVDLLVKYIYNNGIDGVYYPSIHTTYNSQHDLAEKQAYLQKTYSYQSLPMNKVLDSLQAQYLQAGVPLFNGKLLSYGHPAQPGNIQNLYVADPATATNNTQYSKLTYVVNKIRNYLPGNAIFFAGGNTRSVPVPSGEILTAYRCRDTAFWYRYFGPGDTLYNVFIRIPAYIDTNFFAGYQFQGMTFNPGEGNSFSFKVILKNVNAPVKELVLNGFTDFVVAKNQVLRDVLLAHTVNEGIPVADTVNNCERQRLNAAIYEGKINYKLYIDSVRAKLRSDFYAYIMSSGIEEKLYVGYKNQRFNYTLYYYDRAGNLMQTVPPAGVTMLTGSNIAAVDPARASSGWLAPDHNKESVYKYNTLNQVESQQTPDGGRTEYFYDAAGRAIFSQNEKQRQTGRMTYTLYDKQGRIVETGQSQIACVPYFPPYSSPNPYSSNPCSHYVSGMITPFPPEVHDLKFKTHEEVTAYVRSLQREEVVLTHYDKAVIDLPASGAGLSPQDNLRKRVSCIKYFDYLQPIDSLWKNYSYAMHFSYDIAGNVKTLTRDYPTWKTAKQQFKRVDYDYDVISGKVNLLSYNRSYADQYYQRYAYDADNRITKVETSSDGYIWKRDAEYLYYQHGPLARMSLGDLRVQGVDYAYTIQGWLKAINGDLLDSLKDMGKDAAGNSIHAYDAVALSLDYFKGDYRPIGDVPVTHTTAPIKSMYNGNIPRATTSLIPFPDLASSYTYDQLNRIVKADYANLNRNSAALTNTANYYSKYAYDPDGNLKKLVRNGNQPGNLMMDSLMYRYTNNAIGDNKLQNVNDYAANNYDNDLKNHTNAGISRYLYDATGNVIKDQVSGQDTIVWNHYNKVGSTRNDTAGNGLQFAYDGAGNRYMKTVNKTSGDTTWVKSDYYVRDAQGNILAIYNAEDRYGMSKSEWIEYISVQYATPITLEDWINWIIKPHYAQNGFFKAKAIELLSKNGTYMQSAINAHPVSFYVKNNTAVKSNILSHSGDYPDFYQHMNAYSNNSSQPVLGASLHSFLTLDDQTQNFFKDLDIGNDDMKNHILGLMCSTADTLFRDLLKNVGGQYDTTGCSPNVDMMMQVTGKDFNYIGQQLGNMVKLGGYENDYWKFIKTLSLDNVVMDYPPYTSIGNGGTLIPHFQSSLVKYANDSLLGGFFDYWNEAGLVLRNTTKSDQLLEIVYDHDPVNLMKNYITSVDGGAQTLLYQSLAAIPTITPWDFISKISTIVVVDSIIHTVYENVLKYQRISLSSHHLYGSSRLGTKDYLPGQYFQLRDYSGPAPILDTASLTARRPWYSLEYNDNISALTMSPWNMTDVSKYLVSHQVGQKQYELTNHLGNVQATVSDLPVLKGTDDKVTVHAPALPSVYDYYPFGMLMPGRYVSDTTSKCMTVSQTKWVTGWMDSCYWVKDLVVYLEGGAFTSVNLGNLVVTAPASNSGISFDLTAVPDVEQELTFDFADIESGSAYINVSELQNGNAVNIGSLIASTKGSFTLKVKPKQPVITVTALGPYKIAWRKVCVKVPQMVQQTMLVDVCNGVKDRYRFGFNGQEKVNEWAGIGNYLDFGARGLDTRVGRWLAMDPLASKYPFASPYNFSLNTPIQAKDPDGRVVIFINGQHTGEGGTAKYWEGFDKKTMGTIGDFSARYVDGALGGFENTTQWFRKGYKEVTFWEKLVAGNNYDIKKGTLYVFDYSNVNRLVREYAGEAQGMADAPLIYSGLTHGETIKVVTHSMGSAYSRGYIRSLQDYARENGIESRIEMVFDVNAFQGKKLSAIPGVKTYNKTGGNDGKKVFGALYYHIVTGGISVPGVGKVQGAIDITSPDEADNSHEIGKMGVRGLPYLGNGGSESQKPVEQGSNNGLPVKIYKE